jgi:hypothetical protein
MMAAAFRSTNLNIGDTCTNYNQVDITVPGPGTILVTASIQLELLHDSSGGLSDTVWRVGISVDGSTCPSVNAWHGMIPDDVLFEGAFDHGGFTQRTFNVFTPGTYTYYLNGIITVNWHASSDFDHARLVAMYFPS